MKGATLTLCFVLAAGAAGWAQPARRLGLAEAIELGLKANLGVAVAASVESEAAGTAERRRALLLPHVSADHVTSLQNRNLSAMGISLSIPHVNFPTVVGPFSNYDYRIMASQTLVDRQATHAVRAGQRQLEAARLSYQDMRDEVVRQAGGLYLASQAAEAQVEAGEARVTTSRTLVKLAGDQRALGLATGLDLVRAQVQLQRDEQSLLVARNSLQTSLLNLERFVGLEPGAPLELAEPLRMHAMTPPELATASHEALAARGDYRALQSQREGLLEQLRATHARYYPRLGVDGNYGALGRSYGMMPGIGAIEATVSITLFDRDREGEQKELAARMARVESQLADLERGIHQELRQAELDLDSTGQQVVVTEAGVQLARRELELARDRFENGLGDTVEIVQAQGALQATEDEHIQAIARHEDALLALLRALGGTEKIYKSYLGEPAAAAPKSGVEVTAR